MTDSQAPRVGGIAVEPLRESQLAAADDIMRRAFGTFLGMPDPTQFMRTGDYVRTRWAADPTAAFAAVVDGSVAGSTFATGWGSVGFFGPLTVDPAQWGQGLATRLMEPVMDLFSTWGCRHLGLFTFAQSPMHVELYRKFGFWPRSLTAVMRRPTSGSRPDPQPPAYVPGSVDEAVAVCRAIADEVLPGLNLEREIRAVTQQKLGEVVLAGDGDEPDGFAVCHVGAGTEAGEGGLYVKFGAVRPGPGAPERFARLLDACEELAERHGCQHVDAGMNLARVGAYEMLAARGYRTWLQGVAMHHGNEPGYSHEAAWVVDDWR